MRIAEIAESERRGMELRATGFCLALLWGCALAAAAAQGKEGECLRGGRSQQGPRAMGPRALEPHASLRDVLLETDLWLLGSRRAGFGRARGLRSGTILGTLSWDSRLYGAKRCRLGQVGLGGRGKRDAAPATRLQPGGGFWNATPAGRAGSLGGKKASKRTFPGDQLLSNPSLLSSSPPDFVRKAFGCSPRLFGEGASRRSDQENPRWFSAPRFHSGLRGQHKKRLGLALTTHTFPPCQAAVQGSGDRLRGRSEDRKSQSQVY